MDREEILEWCARILGAVIVAVLLVVIAAAFTSCARTIYVPVTSVQHDSIYLHTHSRDSIFVRDSVTIREKGDTVWLERWRIEYRDRIRIDTAYIDRRDSIAVPYPVEKKLSARERLYMGAGKTALPVAAVCVLWLIYRCRRRL